jgi:hypothetical protein
VRNIVFVHVTVRNEAGEDSSGMQVGGGGVLGGGDIKLMQDFGGYIPALKTEAQLMQ